MSIFNSDRAQKLAKVSLLALTMAAVSACTTLRNLPEHLDSEFEHVGPKEFITQMDLARIKLGMSPIEVQNRLGFPMLSDKDATDRWDYVLKRGDGETAEYVPYAVYFKNDKVVRLAPLAPPPPPVVDAPVPAAAPEAVAAEPMPAAEPVADAGVNDGAEINDLLNAWSAAWSAADVDGYLGFYATTFEHGRGSRAAWERQRRQRLTQQGNISVMLSDVQIELQSEVLATATFRQAYSSDKYSDTGMKTLVLSKASGEWKIQSEVFQK